MRRITFLPVSLLLAAITAPVAAQSGTGGPPLSADDVTAIHATIDGICSAALAGDVDRFVALYAANGVEVFQDGRSNVSRANIALRIRPWFESGKFTACTNQVASVEGSGNTAIAVASNTQSWVNSQTQQSTDFAFTWWFVMKKESDGKWRVLISHWVPAS